MSGMRYHLTDDGPRFCTASVRDCPIGGAHFNSKEEATTAFEFRVKMVHSSFSLFKKKPKTIDPHTKHILEANARIEEAEPDLLERDRRQVDGTVFHQLAKEGFSTELLNERFQEETQTRKATIGYGKVNDQEAPVVGIVYGGDYKPEEEEGLKIITKVLAAGEYEPDSVRVYEKDGVTLMAIRGKDSYVFGTDSDIDVLKRPEAVALERFKRQAEDSQFERRWDLEQKSFSELKAEFKDTLNPMPRSKEAIVDAVLENERPTDERYPAVGEFQNGRALVIATNDPLEAKLFRKLKEAHDGGHLRVGGSANPFGRGSLFYDDRDLSRENKVNQIRTDEARRYANAYVSETREKMERMHGRLYSMEPRVDANVQDVRDVDYWIDWDVTGGQRVTGLFSRDQLDRMTTGNFSDVK